MTRRWFIKRVSSEFLVYAVIRSINYIAPLSFLLINENLYENVEDFIANISSMMPVFLLGIPAIISVEYTKNGIPDWVNVYSLLISFIGSAFVLLGLLIKNDYLITVSGVCILVPFYFHSAASKMKGKYQKGVLLESMLYIILSVLFVLHFLLSYVGFSKFYFLCGILFFITAIYHIVVFIRQVKFNEIRANLMSFTASVFSNGIYNLSVAYLFVNIALFTRLEIINLNVDNTSEYFLLFRIHLIFILVYQFQYNRNYKKLYTEIGSVHLRILFFPAVLIILFDVTLMVQKTFFSAIPDYHVFLIGLIHLLWIGLSLVENIIHQSKRRYEIVLFATLLFVLAKILVLKYLLTLTIVMLINVVLYVLVSFLSLRLILRSSNS